MPFPMTTANTTPEQVVDQNGRVYRLANEIGKGGQGTVYLCVDSKYAVKLIRSRNDEDRRRIEKQIAFVQRLPLKGLDMARPLAILASPHLGYTMEYLSGMVSLGSLLKDVNMGYSLRRRLEIMARVADSIRQLHSHGLIYGDASPANIFISKDPKYTEVWLIDCDNLCYASSPSKATFFTPRYGAPELVRGQSGFNTLTDVHSFAVMVFEALTGIHPLIGTAVLNGPPEYEMNALLGDLPWVEATEDLRNHSDYGIPRNNVLSPRLFEVCRKAFEQGLSSAIYRPGIAEWHDKLEWAAAATVVCPKCNNTSYLSEKNCPWLGCGEALPPYLSVKLIAIIPEVTDTRKELEVQYGLKPKALAQKHPVFGRIAISNGEARVMTDFHLAGGNPRHPRFSIQYSGGIVRIDNQDSDSLWIIQENKLRQIKQGASATLSLATSTPSMAVRYGNTSGRHVGVQFALGVASK